MTGDDADVRDLALRLLTHEAGDGSDSLRMADALDRVCHRLHDQLARVVGDLGARLMVRRTLAITRHKFPFLAAEPDPIDGECFGELRVPLQGQEPEMATQAITSLLVNRVLSESPDASGGVGFR